jgi:hypothetical protein
MRAHGDDVSFFDGGPFFRLQRIFHARNPNVRAIDSAIAFVVVTWVVTLILAALSGRSVLLAFLYDGSTHARLLLAGPLALLIEPIIDGTLRSSARYFVSSGLVPEAAQTRFRATLSDVARLRDHTWLEVVLLALAGILSQRVQHAVDAGVAWLAVPTPAAVWYTWVSRPLLNFILMRWLWRVAIWTVFLFRTARIPLRLAAAHPDRSGGLGFLGEAHARFGLIVFSFSVVWSAGWRDKFLYGAATADSLKVSFAIFAALAAFVFLGPLVVFSPALLALRQRALFGYGGFAIRYVHVFEARWLRDRSPPDETLLGTPDVSSLADMQTAVGAVRGVRFLPLDLRNFTMFALGVAPVAALLPLVMPVEELVRRALRPFF